MDFNRGDKIKMTEVCGDVALGSILVVKDYDGELAVEDCRGAVCTCQYKWKKIYNNNVIINQLILNKTK